MRRIALLLLSLASTMSAACDDEVAGGPFDFAFPPRDLSGFVSSDLARPFVDGGGRTGDLAVERDAAAPVRDLAPAGDLLAPCGVVVNEVQIGSAASVADEMVELHNNCASTIMLAANTVLIARAAGDPTTVELQDLGGITIPAGGFRMFTNTAYTGLGASDGVFPISGAGGLRIDDGQKTIAVGLGLGGSLPRRRRAACAGGAGRFFV
jgi:hypothetical protein